MKTSINFLQSFRFKLLEDQLSGEEAVGFFVAVLVVVISCIYIIAPQAFK
jgi:pantothenate synthetase